ncbi:S-adenosyl-L-methionine-dependent methyltransferase [Marasmius fiardii PR-910]|nr:S-adenosyl-L-methionine-dependent methyltransferase [Marasmius fiardii PR-910]
MYHCPPVPAMSSTLKSLAEIISSAVMNLESQYSMQGLKYPSLDDPYSPTALDDVAEVADARRFIIAAAAQLIASVSLPNDIMKDCSTAMYTTATLGFAVDTDISNLLEKAGPEGLHVDRLAETTGLDSAHLGRILRFLATRHIFKESSPNVFRNNRLSSVLRDSKLSVVNSETRHTDKCPSSFSSFVSICADESMKASCHLSDFLRNPGEYRTPFHRAFSPCATTWEWFKKPGNGWRAARFGSAMQNLSDSIPSESLLNAIDWKTLEPDEVVVDVGGGVGSAALLLYRHSPHLKYVVQDLDIQISSGTKFWERNASQGLQSGRVKLQAHDFFCPQPVRGAAAYLLRYITHNWQDSQVTEILTHLRSAANPSSKLVILDSLATFTCEVPSSCQPAPSPLLANFGIAGAGWDTTLDIQMLAYFNTRERMEHEFRQLGEATGWKLEVVKPGTLATLVFRPA